MEKKNALREWVYSLPYSEVNQKRDEIITRCKITPYVWRNWLAGRTPVPELANRWLTISQIKMYLRYDNGITRIL